MTTHKNFNKHILVTMMFGNANIESFKALWDQDKDVEKWGHLLHMCYCEESYESVGGDKGYMENPPINVERLKYLHELIKFLEKLEIKEVR